MSIQQSDRADKLSESATGLLRQSFSNRGFVACLIMLAVFVAGFQLLVSQKKIQFRKLAVELKKPLDQLDKTRLRPYEFLQHFEIGPEVLDELGTEDYIQWIVQDTANKGRSKPEDFIHLFVTYYTGKPDQVPHVPEVCYLGSGYGVVNDTPMEIDIPALGQGFTIPVKLLEFKRTSLLGNQSRYVMYTFNTNGTFKNDRRGVQFEVGDPRIKYAYFSKLEISFGNQDMVPEKEKVIEAGKRFFQTIVPVLVKDHWPDWNEVIREPGTPTGQMENKETPARQSETRTAKP